MFSRNGITWLGRFLFCPEVSRLALEIEKLKELVEAGTSDLFYSWKAWKRLREAVLKLDRYECQRCKNEKKRYRKATIVHHVKHLTDRPDLALSVWDQDTGERQLVSVCKQCHEELHPEAQRQFQPVHVPITQERWD